MSKNTYYSVIRVACALVLIAAVVFSIRSVFVFGGYTYADADKYHAGAARIEEPVENLDIDWTSGNVVFATHSENTVELSETSKKEIKPDYEMRWLLDDGTLRIRFRKTGSSIFQMFGNQQKTLTVTLPEGLKLKDAKICTTSADLDIPSLNTESLELSVTSGDIRAAASAEKISAEMTSGDVFLKSEGEAEEIAVSSTSGEITLETEDVKALSVSSTSGDISVKTGVFDSIDVHATSGDVSAYLPEKPGFTAEVHTTSGKFVHEIPLTQKDSAYVCGDGSGTVRINTTSGDVLIASA